MAVKPAREEGTLSPGTVAKRVFRQGGQRAVLTVTQNNRARVEHQRVWSQAELTEHRAECDRRGAGHPPRSLCCAKSLQSCLTLQPQGL